MIEPTDIVFIGHVDTGKSTLIERLQSVSGTRTDGERVCFAQPRFETDRKRYTILNSPGFRSFPTVLGGVAQADIGVLVISAKKSEFECGFERGGQTRENATLAKTLGIDQLVVVINKMDDQTVEWSKERYDDIVSKLSPFLKDVGYNPGKQLTFIPVSGYTGANLLDRVSKDICPWYDGKAFIETMDEIQPSNRNPDGPLRVPIIDKYKERGTTVILGKVESGRIHVGQKCILMPNKTKVEIVGLKCHDDDYELVNPGENVAIYIKGDEIEVSAGHVLCDEANPLMPVKEFIGQFMVLDKPLFTAGYTAVLHVHTAVEHVTITKIIAKLDKKTGKKLPEVPKFGKTKDLLLVKFELEKSLCVEKFENLPQMGRFTVREGRTVGVGKVTAVKPLN